MGDDSDRKNTEQEQITTSSSSRNYISKFCLSLGPHSKNKDLIMALVDEFTKIMHFVPCSCGSLMKLLISFPK